MEMKNYIFLSTEGTTFQPNSMSMEPDIDNLQVIGFAKGKNEKDAFKRLIKENSYLLNTTFNEIFAYELSKTHQNTKQYFYLSEK